MSILTSARSAAKHRSKTPAELRQELDSMTCHFTELGMAYLTLRNLLDETGIELSGAKLDRDRIADLLAKRNRQVIRQEADIARLRQAVIQARPKITFATAPRVPPFAPLETIPTDAGEPLTVGTWVPFPPEPDGADETTVSIALADILVGGQSVTISGGHCTA